jgi:DNA-binding response OmpR family regulator
MKKKILVVEDERNILLTIRMCLEQAGYEVVMAEDGITAIQKALDSHPDLILLDLIIPKMNGYLVCEAIKQEESTRDIPVMVISARAQEEDIKQAKDLGTVDYIVKPFSPEELRNKIKNILKQEEDYNEKEDSHH